MSCPFPLRLRDAITLPLCLSLLAGCASSNTLQKRKQERAGAYAALPAEIKAMVDQGQIKVGMPMDAVYISWGAPAQILQSENPTGASTTWLYNGGWIEETRFWARRTLQTSYQPRTYVRAEVVFVNGVVLEWRTLPQPEY